MPLKARVIWEGEVATKGSPTEGYPTRVVICADNDLVVECVTSHNALGEANWTDVSIDCVAYREAIERALLKYVITAKGVNRGENLECLITS